jgi:Holliday junction resolvase RusA-like endonuclease
MKAILKKHPELDFFLGFFGGPTIPTKQDKFKPLVGYKIKVDDEETQKEFDNCDLYVKHREKNSLREFEEKFRKQIKESLTDEHPYPPDVMIEMVISVSMDEKRLNEVDIDNLSKSIIDCFNGLVFTDDSQIISLYSHKTINPLVPLNGILVGIRKLKNQEQSWFNGVKLAYFDYEE